MILTITIPDEKKALVVTTLTGIYGRDVDEKDIPTQTDEEFILLGIKKFLANSIREIKKRDYGYMIDSEDMEI